MNKLTICVYKKDSVLDFDLDELYSLYKKYIIPKLTPYRFYEIIKGDIFGNRKYLMIIYAFLWIIFNSFVTNAYLQYTITIALGFFILTFFVFLPAYIWYVTKVDVDNMAPFFKVEGFKKTFCNETGSFFIIVKDRERIVGFIGARTRSESEVAYFQRFLKYKIGKICELQKFIVIPEYRNQKIGSLLLAKSEEIAKEHNYTTMSIETLCADFKNRQIYQHKGYFDVIRKFSYFVIEEVLIFFAKKI